MSVVHDCNVTYKSYTLPGFPCFSMSLDFYIGDASVEAGHQDEQKDDTSIGDTVFSKSWALSVLVRAVEAVFIGIEESLKPGEREREEGEGERGEEEGKGKREGGEGEREEKGEDSLDKGLEEDLCQLWDASMNSVRYHSF